MFFIVLRKGRGAWSILRASIARRLRLKNDPADASERKEQTTGHPDAPDPRTATPFDIHVTPPARRDTRSSDTDGIVNQLALLAASVSRSSPSTTMGSKRSSSPLSTNVQNTRPDGDNSQEYLVAEVESFHYLRSLITVSCMPQPSSGYSSTPSTVEVTDQPPGRKRASSRLSLCLGELPGLPFSKVARKPCHRYTPLPPVYAPKPIAMRPEVRF
ncbi:uncharacterized protein N7482_005685 [Penicillium canariense]|uniref:Uncharacterized protein n=1 Tax=Penicillium canariense TaxID=189055 RepID=A0A9W9I2T7_9EURO|nr:uncharacterized protein N7482_005685 [Penicillium canariense]KAJ5166904.1 hypothetical protein N7482_005685 [Penicillium canariense]